MFPPASPTPAVLTAADLIAALPEGAIVLSPDGDVQEANAAFLALVGRTRAELIATVPEQPWWRVAPGALRSDCARTDVPATLLPAGGEPLAATLTVAPLPGGAVLCLVRDDSDRLAMEHLLRQTGSGLAGAFDSAPTAMVILTGDGRPGVVARTNHAFRALAGAPETALTARPFEQLVHQDDRDALASVIATALQEEAPVRAAIRLRRGDGATRWVQLSVRGVRVDGLGLVEYLLGQLEDVTDQRALEADLAHRAATDPLTGLLNAGSFAEELATAAATHEPAVVVMVDLDDFKTINDHQGHQAGDQVLRSVAARLQSAARGSDSVARVGGDEFALLCRGVADEHGRLALVARLDAALAQAPRVAASVGAALLLPGEAPGEALARADAAMYRRKRGD